MNDDLNTPKLIAELFDACRIINSVKDGHSSLTAEDLEKLKLNFRTFFFDVLGMLPEEQGSSDMTQVLMDLIIDVRKDAKSNKNWPLADLIRNKLGEVGIVIKDTKDGAEWEFKN